MALTYAGDGPRALKVCQQHHQVVRVATVCRCQMFKVLETASAFIGRFEWGIIGPTARSALCPTVQVAGRDTSVGAVTCSFKVLRPKRVPPRSNPYDLHEILCQRTQTRLDS